MAVRKGGRPCMTCGNPTLKEAVESRLRRGMSYSQISREVGIDSVTVSRHAVHARLTELPPIATPVADNTFPVIPTCVPASPAGDSGNSSVFKIDPKWSPREEAEAVCAWLLLKIEEISVIPGASTTALLGEYNKATRHRDKLNGALNLTESQVVRSEPFQRVMNVVKETLRDYPDAVAALYKAFRQFGE